MRHEIKKGAASDTFPHDLNQYPSLDRETLAKLRELDDDEGPSLVEELIEVYFQNSPSVIEGLKNAGEGEDSNALKHYVHKLKGMSANLGAKRLVNLCAIVEQGIRTNKLAELKPVLRQIEDEYDEVLEQLASEIHQA